MAILHQFFIYQLLVQFLVSIANFFNQTTTVFIGLTKLMVIIFLGIFQYFFCRNNFFVLGLLMTKFFTNSTSNFLHPSFNLAKDSKIMLFNIFILTMFPIIYVIYESYINAQGRWYIKTSEPMHFLFIWIFSFTFFWILF